MKFKFFVLFLAEMFLILKFLTERLFLFYLYLRIIKVMKMKNKYGLQDHPAELFYYDTFSRL